MKNALLALQGQNIEFDVGDVLDRYLKKRSSKKDDVVHYFKPFLAAKCQLIDKDIKISAWGKLKYARPDVAVFNQF